MTDYIDRQAAIDAIDHICPVDTEYDCTLLDRVDVRYVLSDLPSAQIDIVHCRECIYGAPNGKYGCKGYHYKLYETHDMGADDFCSKGERKKHE